MYIGFFDRGRGYSHRDFTGTPFFTKGSDPKDPDYSQYHKKIVKMHQLRFERESRVEHHMVLEVPESVPLFSRRRWDELKKGRIFRAFTMFTDFYDRAGNRYNSKKDFLDSLGAPADTPLQKPRKSDSVASMPAARRRKSALEVIAGDKPDE